MVCDAEGCSRGADLLTTAFLQPSAVNPLAPLSTPQDTFHRHRLLLRFLPTLSLSGQLGKSGDIVALTCSGFDRVRLCHDLE